MENVIVPSDIAAGILDSVTDAFFALDRDWRFTFVNRTAEQLLEHARDELLGNVVWDMFPEAVGSEFEAHYARAVTTGTSQFFEAFYPPLDTWFEVRAFPAREGLAVYFADISERIAARQERDELLTTLNAAFEITDVILSALDVETLLASVLKKLVPVLGADTGAVLLAQDDGSVRVRATCGLDGAGYDGVVREPGVGFVGTIVSHREPAFMPDTLLDPDAVSSQLVAAGVRSILGAPLLSGEGLVGVIHVDWLEPHEHDRVEDTVLRTVADRLALAIQNAHLYDEVRQAERFSASLNRLNAILHGSLEADEIRRMAVAEVTSAMRCDSSAFDVYRDGWWVPLHVQNLPEEMLGQEFSDEEIPFAAAAVRRGEPIAVDDALNDPQSSREVQERYGIPSVLVVPLLRRGRVYGVLFFNFHTPHHFTDAEIDFARKFGAVVSLAMENAELFETEHRVAHVLQEALIAVPERVDGVLMGKVYRSATAQTLVGGDFYDVFELADERLGVVIGDVSGKGIDAAVLTSLVRHTLRAYAEEPGASPAQTVARANNLIERDSDPATFVTLLFGILDRRDGTFVYCNAAHTTCAIVADSGDVRTLDATSPLVGAFRDVAFVERATHVGADETLFLYTDGLMDAPGDTERFGEARLLALLGEVATPDPSELVVAVLGAVESFARDGFTDDVCILALRPTPPVAAPQA